MNHKRGRSKNRRAGCLMCKANKMNGWPDDKYYHYGFGVVKKSIHTKQDMQEIHYG